jgi:hypothetical protein
MSDRSLQAALASIARGEFGSAPRIPKRKRAGAKASKPKASSPKARKRTAPSPRARTSRLDRLASTYPKRFVAVRVKEWRGERGPLYTIVGGGNTLAAAKQSAERGTRAGLHVIVDKQTGQRFTAHIIREYKFTTG